jgi:hypothetical protein
MGGSTDGADESPHSPASDAGHGLINHRSALIDAGRLPSATGEARITIQLPLT